MGYSREYLKNYKMDLVNLTKKICSGIMANGKRKIKEKKDIREYLFTIPFWFLLYFILGIIAWNTETKTPSHFMGGIAIFSIIFLIDIPKEQTENETNKWKWVSIHLFGLLMAVYTADFKLW